MNMMSILRRIKKKLFPAKKGFRGSKKYWEKRYANNRNSGAGSYGRLANFKADIINDFVSERNVKVVVELGSGDGNQLTLANYPHYIGYDVSQTAVELCNEKFKNDASKEFHWLSKNTNSSKKGDLTLSLDVIYHLIEDSVYEAYMRQLFSVSEKYVIIYASDYDEVIAPHVRSRKFTTWVDKHIGKEWKLLQIIKNKYPFDPEDPNHTSISDFFIYQKAESIV